MAKQPQSAGVAELQPVQAAEPVYHGQAAPGHQGHIYQRQRADRHHDGGFTRHAGNQTLGFPVSRGQQVVAQQRMDLFPAMVGLAGALKGQPVRVVVAELQLLAKLFGHGQRLLAGALGQFGQVGPQPVMALEPPQTANFLQQRDTAQANQADTEELPGHGQPLGLRERIGDAGDQFHGAQRGTACQRKHQPPAALAGSAQGFFRQGFQLGLGGQRLVGVRGGEALTLTQGLCGGLGGRFAMKVAAGLRVAHDSLSPISQSIAASIRMWGSASPLAGIGRKLGKSNPCCCQKSALGKRLGTSPG